MSSILKALRKLEEEKAARREGAFDLARDILRAPDRQKRRGRFLMMAAAAATALFFGAAGYGLFSLLAPAPASPPILPGQSRSVTAPADAPGTAAVAKSSPDAVSRLPAGPEPPIMEVHFAAEESAALPDAKPGGKAAAGNSEPAEATPRTAGAEPPAPRRPDSPPAGEPSAEAKILPAHLPKPKPAGLPTLVVSAIVFQANPQARVAVINGLPVMKGSVIEGAVVEDILRKSVRFLQNGRSFEVALKE